MIGRFFRAIDLTIRNGGVVPVLMLITGSLYGYGASTSTDWRVWSNLALGAAWAGLGVLRYVIAWKDSGSTAYVFGQKGKKE